MSPDDLAPGYLIASPRLDGGPFERALIVLVQHDEEGTMGFILNKPLTLDLGTLLENAESKLSTEVDAACFEQHVYFGGPVRVEQLWIMVNRDVPQTGPHQLPGTIDLNPSWSVIADATQIESFIGGSGAGSYRPFIGYTGWDAGQLAQEIEQGSWLYLPFDESRLFEAKGPVESWEGALKALGVNPMAFLMMGKAVKA